MDVYWVVGANPFRGGPYRDFFEKMLSVDKEYTVVEVETIVYLWRLTQWERATRYKDTIPVSSRRFLHVVCERGALIRIRRTGVAERLGLLMESS